MGFPAVAYNNLDGSGFLGGTTPMIIADFDTMADVFEKAKELDELGYSNVVIFNHPDDDEQRPEELSWEYVRAHEIKF